MCIFFKIADFCHLPRHWDLWEGPPPPPPLLSRICYRIYAFRQKKLRHQLFERESPDSLTIPGRLEGLFTFEQISLASNALQIHSLRRNHSSSEAWFWWDTRECTKRRAPLYSSMNLKV